MNLPQLIDFLETKNLHFARVDTLGDPYEGSWTRLDMAAREQQLIKRSTSKLITDYLRGTMYINCWHANNAESAAMWKLYGTSAGSIAIQSTYKKLAGVLPDDTFMGMVQYKNYSSLEEGIPGDSELYPFFHKRREFEHEKEVRAFIWTTASKQRLKNPDDQPLGIKVDIDIDKAVETIRVQPTTPAWVRKSIEKLLERYDWGMKVMPSQIDVKPMY